MALASSDARVLSIALVLLADDHGRGRASRVMLAGQVFPGKSLETLADALEELRVMRYVVLYEDQGQKYFWIRNWDKHQKVDHPSKARLPAPPSETTTNTQSVDLSRETVDDTREVIANPRASRGSLVQVQVAGPGTGTGPDPERDLVAMSERVLRDRCGAELEWPAFQTWPEVKVICDAFAETYGRRDDVRHGGDPRAKAILGRFSEGYAVETLVLAVRNSKFADYMAEKQSNQALVTILRDASQVDKFAALTGESKRPNGIPPPRQPDAGVSAIANAREST